MCMSPVNNHQDKTLGHLVSVRLFYLFTTNNMYLYSITLLCLSNLQSESQKTPSWESFHPALNHNHLGVRNNSTGKAGAGHTTSIWNIRCHAGETAESCPSVGLFFNLNISLYIWACTGLCVHMCSIFLTHNLVCAFIENVESIDYPLICDK